MNDPFTENDLKRKLTLSFAMERELAQCFTYLSACGLDIGDTVKTFMDSDPRFLSFSKKTENDAPICKNDSKAVLSAFRDHCISCTPESGKLETSGKPKETQGKTSASLGEYCYLEEGVSEEDIPEGLKKRIRHTERIRHYKDVFNAKAHDFLKEKHSGTVIVAKNRDTLLYPGAPFCQSFGNEHFYYASCVKNCIYDCAYCYLKGMYPCGFLTVFVNIEDYFKELEEILKEHPVYLCVSYDTDLLALEGMLGFCEKWIGFANGHKDLKIEIRTKCANSAVFKRFPAPVHDNVIFAWTLSPDEVREFAEKGTPSSKERLKAAAAAHKAGFPVRFCFDPIVFHKNWRESYTRLFDETFATVPPEEVLDISAGVFRISNNYLKRMRDCDALDPVTAFPFVTEQGASHYGCLSDEMRDFAVTELAKRFPKEKTFIW
ncbi:MAG: radical SAM protein [Lachnospiraceae bacterium]|nr:radical SAM protein [Lachnospiraceae bacterium]